MLVEQLSWSSTHSNIGIQYLLIFILQYRVLSGNSMGKCGNKMDLSKVREKKMFEHVFY